MTTTELRTASVDLSRLITILGENLYSTPAVVVRELVQNAHDSCVRRELEKPRSFAPRITLTADPARGTLTIEDTGSGLTRAEIVDCLATVGAGYTRRLRETTGDTQLVGAFGLGFLSAYVVSSLVSVWTCSADEPEVAWHFRSTTGETFTLEPAELRPPGTRITLTLRERFASLAQEATIAGLARRYCALLRVPIAIGEGTPINVTPPWRDPSVSPFRAKRAKLDFAARFEPRFAPLCTLDAASEAGDLAGLLWVQDGATYGTSDNRHLAVYVRGMLISDDMRDLLPRWAGFVGGVIETTALVPTASREDVVKNDGYRALARSLEQQLVAGLAALARREPEAWRRTLSRHNEALLGAALCDPRLFSLLADELTVPTSEGDLRVPELLARSDGKVHVSMGDESGVDHVLLAALKVPVVRGARYAVVPFLTRYTSERRGELLQIGTSQGNKRVFPEVAITDNERAWLEECLGQPGRRVVASRFAPRELPLVPVANEEARLKERLESDESDERISAGALTLARHFTRGLRKDDRSYLYVNLDSPAIAALLGVRGDAGRRPASLLRMLAGLLGGARGDADLPALLAGYSTTICELIGVRGDGPGGTAGGCA
jgi:molecular chaperone HtpG